MRPHAALIVIVICHNQKQQFFSLLTFRASLNTNHEERKKLLIYPHLYIGKAALVEYYGLTDKGVPRNATAKEIA